MKSQRSRPGIFSARSREDARAELDISKLSLHFGGVRALHDIDLAVRTGELVAVIGPNGAGKTVQHADRRLPDHRRHDGVLRR